MGKAERDNAQGRRRVRGRLSQKRQAQQRQRGQPLHAYAWTRTTPIAGLMDDLDMTFINAYALYSTHSHTPEKMRLRLIIPLSRTVTPDEYAAVSRRIADDLTLSRFDPTTFEPARLMYWPSAPEDGEYVFQLRGRSRFSTRTRCWPPMPTGRTPRSGRPRSRWRSGCAARSSKAGRPADQARDHRRVLPGAQHHRRAGDTSSLDRYTPTAQDDRYTFVGGSTTGGLVVYDDKFAFSHHATDPGGRASCATPLIWCGWHLFPPGGTARGRHTSWATTRTPSP